MREKWTLTEGQTAQGRILPGVPGVPGEVERRDSEEERRDKWKQTEFCSPESHRLSESSVTKQGQRVGKVTQRRPLN